MLGIFENSSRFEDINFITQTHVGMDYAPFKKPSRLAGLFSYRSVIPPFPHETLLCKLSWGPCPTGQGGEQASISSRKRTSEWTTLHSKSPASWLGFSHTAPSFLLLPTKLCNANFRGGPALRAQKGSRCQFHHANSRRNGLRSIQKAQPFGWAFLIPLRHSSFSPQNFAVQTFVGTPPYGPRRGAGINFITQTHVKSYILRNQSVAFFLCHHIVKIPPCYTSGMEEFL